MNDTTNDGAPAAHRSAQTMSEPGAVARLAPAAEPIRVLVTDSRPLVVGALADLIERQGPGMCLVGQAGSYARALYLAERMQPDVVLLSVFPDTLDPLLTVSSIVRLSRARVLLLKGMHDTVPVARLLGAGAAAVVITEDPTDAIVRAILQVHAAPRPSATEAPILRADDNAAHPRRRQNALTRLTERERQLIRVIVGKPSAKYLAIGAQLGISEHTVHNHLTSIYQKLNVVNRTDMLLYAVRNGLVDDPPLRDAFN